MWPLKTVKNWWKYLSFFWLFKFTCLFCITPWLSTPFTASCSVSHQYVMSSPLQWTNVFTYQDPNLTCPLCDPVLIKLLSYYLKQGYIAKFDWTIAWICIQEVHINSQRLAKTWWFCPDTKYPSYIQHFVGYVYLPAT